MPQCQLAVKDTVTGLWMTSYSTTLGFCQWSTDPNAAMCCDTMSQGEFNGMLTNMNSQTDIETQFIGQNPHLH